VCREDTKNTGLLNLDASFMPDLKSLAHLISVAFKAKEKKTIMYINILRMFFYLF
jgi:hypothetical protein